MEEDERKDVPKRNLAFFVPTEPPGHLSSLGKATRRFCLYKTMANSVLGRPFVHPLTSLFSRRVLGLRPDIIACSIYLTENLCEYNMYG